MEVFFWKSCKKSFKIGDSIAVGQLILRLPTEFILQSGGLQGLVVLLVRCIRSAESYSALPAISLANSTLAKCPVFFAVTRPFTGAPRR